MPEFTGLQKYALGSVTHTYTGMTGKALYFVNEDDMYYTQDEVDVHDKFHRLLEKCKRPMEFSDFEDGSAFSRYEGKSYAEEIERDCPYM